MSRFSFDVHLYGETRPISPVISQGRVRIFYKGLNRNRTYITDEFAEKLLSTLPYTPIVGKYENGDYTDHGHDGEQLQVYGVVPENPNISWETHLDYDGVERTYACADVLIWTARFPEGKTLLEKGQSMEIYDKSVDGQWVYEEGQKFFKFIDGCFLGLAALGDNTEPCFEGAAFYAYADSLKELIQELNAYNQNNGGSKEMEYQFKLSDSQKENAIFELINPNLESGYFESFVCDVYDDYALCFNYDDGKYFRAYYNKSDETDSVEITQLVDAYVLDVTEQEYQILQRLGEMSNQDYSLIEQEVISFREAQKEEPPIQNNLKDELEDNSANEQVDFSLEIEKLQSQISELEAQNSTYKLENEKLENEISSLSEYKKLEETAKKETVLNKYSKKLPEEVVTKFKEKMQEYSLEDFKKEIAFEVLNSNEEALFETKQQEYLPSDQFNTMEHLSGAEKLLAKRLKNKKN
jgi:hypothetical protein